MKTVEEEMRKAPIYDLIQDYLPEGYITKSTTTDIVGMQKYCETKHFKRVVFSSADNIKNASLLTFRMEFCSAHCVIGGEQTGLILGTKQDHCVIKIKCARQFHINSYILDDTVIFDVVIVRCMMRDGTQTEYVLRFDYDL